MATKTFQSYLETNHLPYHIDVSSSPTHTAEEAARANNISVEQIVKSLLVKIDGAFVLYLVPGHKRLSLDDIRAEKQTSEVKMATAEEVKEITGYSIGGVPPFGHTRKLQTVIYDGFPEDGEVVAAAGAPNATFRIGIKELRELVL